jgi:hypothetical protein
VERFADERQDVISRRRDRLIGGPLAERALGLLGVFVDERLSLDTPFGVRGSVRG